MFIWKYCWRVCCLCSKCCYLLQAIELAQIMDQSLDENNIELVLRCIMIAESRMSSSSCKAVQSITSELANTFHSCFSESWVYSKVVLLGISFLEREQRYAIYNQNSFFPFLKRIIVFLLKVEPLCVTTTIFLDQSMLYHFLLFSLFFLFPAATVILAIAF